MEGKAAALKQEALQHLFIALAGSDCCELWNLLVTFFGKGADTDPFEFLDAAPAIKQPLDLADTDSYEEASVASSAASVATTALESGSTTTTTLSTSTRKDFKLAPRPSWPDLVASIKQAEGFVPKSAAALHHTSIPEGVTCKRSSTQMSRGASLYVCPHPDCGTTPYVGDLPRCGSHFRQAHYGTCLLCPFCPNHRYYRVSGWRDHMQVKHCSVPQEIYSVNLLSKLTEEIYSVNFLSKFTQWI